ncbi:MAG: helix-turn-helix domain-containing protein [Magnetococcales bacterium]|nr:helix-turn-helix domain-containing protein [Magnetococcales bacterium]
MHLEDQGWSLSRLGQHHGFSRYAGSKALDGPYLPEMERIIAQEIGVRPEEIWPSRYPNGVRAPRCVLMRQYDYITPRRGRTNKQEMHHG